MTRYAYARKEFPISLMEQVALLVPYECEELIIEEALLKEKTQLSILMTRVTKGDTIVLTSFQSLGGTFSYISDWLADLQAKQVSLISIWEKVDTRQDVSFLSHMSHLRRAERACRSHRLIQASRERMGDGSYGRPPIDSAVTQHIKFLYHEQKRTMRQIAQECQVSLGSVAKYTKDPFKPQLDGGNEP